MSNPVTIQFNAQTLIDSFVENRSEEQRKRLKKHLPELVELERVILNSTAQIKLSVLSSYEWDEIELPQYCLQLGEFQSDQPRLLIVGGVHGLERIGSRVIIALLETWLHRMEWDVSMQECLKKIAVTFVPIVNLVGMYKNQRSNGNGVDLMRNGPIEAEGKVPFLAGGHRYTRWLPWYRGYADEMEKENRALEGIIKQLTIDSPLLISLDCHSGFGFRDRLWFPYAYRRRPLSGIAPFMALKLLWDKCYPNHRYLFEPQSSSYLTHGDFWDHCYKRFGRQKDGVRFLPLTLEMGSWNWVKKNPLQGFSLEGMFNPMVQHRERRVLRHHFPFLDFLLDATLSYENWLPDTSLYDSYYQMARSLWYRS
ncbi:M14 family zinc carboxypeptidase [Pleionea sp. CnH1-48]|uniref:M14 family zinc carboxypeptidase n=1 Tax=Pleionea sp. CnH1-48 TaxID=2954494 RepID=UPI002097BF34|nr:M14 family zinc carboxypeptidase [Pleionea sp. CnH1-48]MCO7224658.1 DUF2817 domain-containing protein [Pleionea sp. CnH1-48]